MTTIDSELQDGMRRLRLRSEGPNTLDATVVATLRSHLHQAAQAGEPVLLGSASRFFCNGLDLAWALGRSRAELRAFFLAMGGLVLDLLELPVPVACAMTGHAVGAGKSLVLASDVRIGGTAKCLLGAPEVKLGVPNPVFADRLLRAVASDRVANDLLYSGRLVTAEEAVSLGLLDGAVAPDAVEPQAVERLRALAAQPRRAWAATKRQRSLDLCAAIRGQLESHIDGVVLEHWFSDEAQRLLHAAAAALTRIRPVQ
jgi:enoyl-CoA hydratase/carnithine racemase